MKRTSKKGFTIVELLTVMGVIAVLIGLMVPALALVKDYSKRIQQKAQFHGIDMGLEMYKTEFGSYPRSDDNSLIPPHPILDNSPYCGANKLAEAMVGLDLIGFHPSADFRSDGRNTVVDDNGIQATLNVYDTQGTQAGWPAQKNIDARKGPFVDLEKVNAFRLDEVYANALAPFTNNFATLDAQGNAVTLYPLVLCDVYAQKRSGTGAKKTGTPILYYRARTNYSQQNFSIDGVQTDDIYNYYDNANLLALGMPNDGTTYSVTDLASASGDPLIEFEKMIINDNVQTIRRPFRADSYILISAGKDGDFGTADDVFNFDKEVTE
jgi:prepilin-type N-terminal cleavage/methylation domain-containing protein